jgi:hypothetical protein
MFLAAVTVGADLGCRREEEAPAGGAAPDKLPAEQAGVLVFPEELKVEDDSVNEFLTRAMTVCTTGDYEAFRLLWNVREEPLARDEFEKGWQAVEEIRVRALEKVILASDEGAEPGVSRTAYVTCADVRLDAERITKHPGREIEAERQVVLMLLREHDEWGLAWAPKHVRTWIEEKVGPHSPPVDTPQTPIEPQNEG